MGRKISNDRVRKIRKRKNKILIAVEGTNKNEKIYVQVTYLLASEETIRREFSVYDTVQDHYPKYVVTTNALDAGNENGIRIVHLADFLLMEQW